MLGIPKHIKLATNNEQELITHEFALHCGNVIITSMCTYSRVVYALKAAYSYNSVISHEDKKRLVHFTYDMRRSHHMDCTEPNLVDRLIQSYTNNILLHWIVLYNIQILLFRVVKAIFLLTLMILMQISSYQTLIPPSSGIVHVHVR